MYRINLCALSTALFSLALSAPSLADQIDDEDTRNERQEANALEHVKVVGKVLYLDQVNALHTPTPIIDVPQSLSIITADEITELGITGIDGIVDYTPGLSNSQGEGHRDAVVFRGVRSTADFFIDGARDDVQYYRPLYNLEQVEILRGPNALFFGRGGAGGVLNRVTKKSLIGESITGIQAGLDSFGGYDVQIDRNFAAGENAAFRVNAMYEQLENHRDYFGGERSGINPTARFMLTPDTTLDLSYEYVDHERFIDRGIPTGTDGRPVKDFRHVVFGDPELNKTTLDAHLLRAALQHEFSDSLKANFSAFYGDYDKFYQNFYVSAYDQANSPDVVTLDGYADTTRRDNLILSANLVGEFGTGNVNHTVVAGAEFIDTSSDQDRYNASWDTTMDDNEVFSVMRPIALGRGVGVNANGVTTTSSFTTDLNDDTRVNIEVFSFFAQDEIELSDQFDLVVGARFDSFDIEVFDVPTGETRTRTDEEVSPRLGLVYKPHENISLYGSYSESFLPRSGEQFANINGDNNQLDPDTFTNLEAGLKWDFEHGLSLTAALFEIEQSSPQVSDNDPETLDVIDSEITGFELQLRGQVTDRWSMVAGYSYLDGEQESRFGPTGLRPRELPENMFSIWNHFQATQNLGLGLGLVYQDESFIDNGNTAVLPSYTRIDAAAYYDLSEALRLQLNIENLNDELYFPSSHSTHQVTVGAPRNARMTVIWQY